MPDVSARPTISVAMCTYNGERHLPEQLETIKAQSRLPFELIVCDDGSNDGTLAQLESFARQSPFPVQVHRNPIQLGSTRNFDQAIRLCGGDYIALSDQDDRWQPEKLARLGALLDACPDVSVAFSNAALIDDTSRATGRTLWQTHRFTSKVRALFLSDPGAVLLERPVVTGATMLFRRSLLQHFAAIPPAWVHDAWITWMGALRDCVLFSQECLTEYRVHPTQQLGISGTSVSGKLQRIRNQQRGIYARLAKDLHLLRSYIEEQSSELGERNAARWMGRIQKSSAFFEARANAPASVGGRLVFLARHFAGYRALPGATWRTLLRDLTMGPDKGM